MIDAVTKSWNGGVKIITKGRHTKHAGLQDTVLYVIFQSLAIVTVKWKPLHSHTDSGLADKTKQIPYHGHLLYIVAMPTRSGRLITSLDLLQAVYMCMLW
jgi:hypothetical protein